MGRNRSFDEATVVAECAAAFLRTGYEGTSIDDLVTASGLHRGSLYKAFGSKRGLFVAALRHSWTTDATDPDTVDLLLVALLELAPRDAEIRALSAELLARGDLGASALGGRLLQRALLTADPTTTDSKGTSE